jgi:hypothetical protein
MSIPKRKSLSQDHEDMSIDNSCLGSEFTDNDTSSNFKNSTSNQKRNEVLGLSNEEERAVSCSRWIFLTCLVLVACMLGTIIYLVTKNEEVEDFETQVRMDEKVPKKIKY